MTNLLAITSSPNPQGVTTGLIESFVENYKSALSDLNIVRRDLGLAPPPHLDGATIGAFYTQPEDVDDATLAQLALSDEMVGELEAADVIVIAAPMHNFGLASGLKSWIDHVSRVGRTFNYTAEGPNGMLTGKKVFVLGARGGNYSSTSPAHGMDFVTPYLKTALGFIGLDDVTFINAEGVASGQEGIELAHQEVKSVVIALAA